MDYFRVGMMILFGLCIRITSSSSISVFASDNFTISTATTDWISSCHGNKPAVVKGVHWDTLSADGNISVPENGDKVWIGYIRRYQYFSVKGCASATSGGTLISNVDNPLGLCFTQCNDCNNVGIADQTCHCLSDDDFNALPMHNGTCPYKKCGHGIVCGSGTSMWIYGRVNPTFHWNSDPPNSDVNNCISIVQTPGVQWNVVDCSGSFRVLCMKRDGTFDAKEAVVVRGVSWDSALNVCHNKFENLANISYDNYRDVIINQNISTFYYGWTSFVRDAVVVPAGFEETPTEHDDCTVIYKSNGKLSVGYQPCKNLLPAVCLEELPSTSTLTTTFTGPMATTRTSSAPTTTGTSNHPSTASSTMVINTSNIQPTTTTSHTVATGTSPKEKSATRSIETGTTTTSATQMTTYTSSTTESITTSVAISPSTSTVTTTTTFTTPMAATRTTAGPMTKGSNTSTTNISNQQPNTSTTIIFNTSTTQPTTSTKLTSATDSTTTVTSATSNTRPVTTNAGITQGANNSSTTTVFPMTGRIGLGILAILVVAGVVLLIKKMTPKEKRLPSIETTADSSDHKTELPKGIPMLYVNKKEVSNNDGENEIKMKVTSIDCFNDEDGASDPNYACIQDESNIKHSNDRVGNSTAQKDNAYSTNSQYATVVKVGKSSPEITETTPESDTNAYDTTYVQQEKSRDTGDDYQHIYDHANSKNPE